MKKYLAFSLAFVFIFLISGTVGAVDITAKAYGMGGAFTGIANDATSILYNPAGLNQSGFLGLQINGGLIAPSIDALNQVMEIPEYMENFDQYTPGELQDKFPESTSVDGQAFMGANFKSVGLGVNLVNRFKTGSSGSSVWLEDRIVTEGIISFGRKLLDPPLDVLAFSYGFNLKMHKTDYGRYEVDTDESGIISGDYPGTIATTASGNGFGLDAGVLLKVTDLVTVGAQVRNLIAGEYGITGTQEIDEYDPFSDEWTSNESNYSEKVTPERVARVGAAVKIPLLGATLAADIDNFPLFTDNNKEMVYHFGVEKNLLFNSLSLRAGTFNQPEGSQVYTMGLGFNLFKFHVDLAAGSDDGFQDNISGVISANMKF